MKHRILLAIALCLTWGLSCESSHAQSSGDAATYRPSDPIASVDSAPVFLGELNYLLVGKLKIKNLDAVPMEVQRASAALLVKQHLALSSLKRQGGQALQQILDRDWQSFVDELSRQGTSIDQYCSQRSSDAQSVRNSHDWDAAWRSYVKSKMTDENLKRFYQSNAETYADVSWDVSHIFLPVEKDQANSKAIAEQRMTRIVTDLAASSSPAERANRFAELARQESDGSTAKQGGRIGWVSKPGDLPSAVLSQIRQISVGETTSAVESPLGFHLALVHDRRSESVAFEQLADQSQLRRDAASRLFDTLAKQSEQATVIWYMKQLRPDAQ